MDKTPWGEIAFPLGTGNSGVTFWELVTGHVACGWCGQHHLACQHIGKFLQGGGDAGLGRFSWDLYGSSEVTVSVPVLSESTQIKNGMICAVILGPADDHRMRDVTVPNVILDGDDTQMRLGWIGPRDGRWVIREMLVDWLAGLGGSPRLGSCGRCGSTEFPWDPTTPAGLQNTWRVVRHASCTRCAQAPKGNLSTSDFEALIPQV